MKALTKSAGIADSFLSTFTTMTQTGLQAANMSIHSKEFRKIMDQESFDLVVVGIFTNNFLVGKYPSREERFSVTANSTRFVHKIKTHTNSRLRSYIALGRQQLNGDGWAPPLLLSHYDPRSSMVARELLIFENALILTLCY